jgi:hypothetical protein
MNGAQFNGIAPYLKDPLVLIGFFLFLGFLFLRLLIRKGIIPSLNQDQGLKVLRWILLYGFIIGLVLIFLGFGLKYRELSETEQKSLVEQLSQEMDTNLSVIGELKKNTESFLNQQINISRIVRTPRIKILSIMFPEANLDLNQTVNDNELARDAYLELIKKGLPNNREEMSRLNQAAVAISKTLLAVRSTNQNLRDSSRTRYLIQNEVWKANLPIYKKVNIINITTFQKVYKQFSNIRNDYEIIAKANIDFENAMFKFLKPDNDATWQELANVLTAERNSYDLMVVYSKNIVDAITDVNAIKKKLDADIEKL